MELIENQALGISIAFIYGLLFGSFATMASHRIPLGEELVFTPSHCPKCDHKLSIIDLFPVFSWVFNIGKCHYCDNEVHWRYPAIELATGCLFGIFYWKSGFSLQTLSYTLMTVCVIISVVILIEKKQISNLITTCLIPIAILYKYSINSDPIDYFILSILAFITLISANFLYKPFKKEPFCSNKTTYLVSVIFLFVEIDSLISFIILLMVLFLISCCIIRDKKYKLSLHTSLFASLLIHSFQF